MPPKVLVGTPTYEGKDYCIDDHKRAIQALNYPNYKHIIVDNTENVSYLADLKRRGYDNVLHVDRGKNSMSAIRNSYQRIFDYARDNDYDYLLTVEVDLMPRPDAVWRLLRSTYPVAGSWYWLKSKGDVQLPMIYVESKLSDGRLSFKLLGSQETPQGNILDKRIIESWRNTGVRECVGAGFGCTLISRDVLEQFPQLQFIPGYDNNKPKHVDSWFYHKCMELEIPCGVDTDRVVEHRPSDWEQVKDWY